MEHTLWGSCEDQMSVYIKALRRLPGTRVPSPETVLCVGLWLIFSRCQQCAGEQVLGGGGQWGESAVL